MMRDGLPNAWYYSMREGSKNIVLQKNMFNLSIKKINKHFADQDSELNRLCLAQSYTYTSPKKIQDPYMMRIDNSVSVLIGYISTIANFSKLPSSSSIL